MIRKIYLSLGSNIEPEKYIPACLKTLKQNFSLQSVSSVYETDPVGVNTGSKFWNAAVEIKSDLEPEELGKAMREIETLLGRKRNPADKFAPRTIDIDILPQPGYQNMGFIMIPLAEIAPEEKDVETGKTFRELAEKFSEEKKKYRRVDS